MISLMCCAHRAASLSTVMSYFRVQIPILIESILIAVLSQFKNQPLSKIILTVALDEVEKLTCS